MPTTSQARYIEAAVNGILVACIYLPNGNPQPGPKFDYKLAWFKRLHTHARKLLKAGAPIVLAGDFNVAPTEIDIYPTTSWDDNALVQPQSRAAYAKLVKQGWTDALRELHGDERVYTFWHYMRNRFARDAGLRLDHILLSPQLAATAETRGRRSRGAREGGCERSCAGVGGVEVNLRPLALAHQRLGGAAGVDAVDVDLAGADHPVDMDQAGSWRRAPRAAASTASRRRGCISNRPGRARCGSPRSRRTAC